MDELSAALEKQGYAVQLKHVDKETGNGWVRIQSASGAVLAKSDDLQHNRNFDSRPKRVKELVETVKAQATSQKNVDGEADQKLPLFKRILNKVMCS